MQKLQDSVFSIIKTTNLSPAVFSFLQPSDESGDKTPLGGILKDTKYGWLALGPKFCVVDLRTGLKVAAKTFGASLSNNTAVTSVVELPTPLTNNSQQLVISLQCDDIGLICVLHINGSQILRCMQTDVVVTELAVCDRIPDGPFTCFDGLVMAGTKRGEIFVFDLNRASLIQALKDISQGYEHLIQNEANPTSLSFLPLKAIHRIEEQRELALENDHHLAILLNENSMVDGQYIFRNPDGTVRMKAKRDHIRVTVLQYIPQLGSMAVGYNFGAFQIWNVMTLDLEFTSQVNVECLPVTHFGFQEPCDDPRAFCYLWVIFSVIDRYEDEEFPLAVMYSLTYQGKRMLSDTKCLYQDFSTATIRFQVELSTLEEAPLLGGKCIACHTYSIKSNLGDEGEDSMLNICQIVWECWGEDANSPMQYGMLVFDLDQWYKDQMPATWRLESNAFMSATWCGELAARGAVSLHVRLDVASVCPYSHATRLEEHFYPNSLQYNCICLNTSEALTLRTVGVQRALLCALEAAGPAALLHPRLHAPARAAALHPLYCALATASHLSQEDQRRYLLSVALEARLSRFLKRCAHDWAAGSHSGVGCTLPFLVDWCWQRAIELKENAKELTAPLFVSAALPDRNLIRCLEHCVQQLAQLTGLMDAILTKCCNLVVPDALSEIEEKHKGIGCVSLYFRVVQWFLRVGLLPEREGYNALPYAKTQLSTTYNKRRIKLNRLHDNSNLEESAANKSCPLLYIDQLIEHEFGGDRIHQMWIKGGSESGLYPPPSLYSLLRLYLLPEIPDEQKHSLVLYLLVDYSMVYDEIRYEEVIRRLMQFPTMFGLSNTAIKATQAFWHLDHRDFDFALDQLQCLTGNTLSEWQHNVVLSSLLAQKKTQAALQYLHVRKPAPIQNIKDIATTDMNLNYAFKLNDRDKLENWQSCCNLYLARGLVFQALDVIRMCVQNAPSLNDKAQVLNFFFKGCRNTGNLSKILQVTLLPFEEEVFVKYLENCNESQTSDILIMYYLQQARYLEAERYNNKLKVSKPRNKDMNTSAESLFEIADREGARDALVDVACVALPTITAAVASVARDWRDIETHVNAPKPMSVFVQAKSPKNTFTYKSSFIQDTIENASETWMNRPKMRKGLKRALDIEETPFICTPKLLRTRSIFTEQLQSDSTPPKRPKLDLTATPKTPRHNASFQVSEKLSSQMEQLLDMPEVQSPVSRVYNNERAETPHSILKIRRNERDDAPSPVDSRYLGDSEDELLETASSHTHYSDSTNKHLRFTIPTASESGSTPSPTPTQTTLIQHLPVQERERSTSATREKEMDISIDSFVTTTSHALNDMNPLESPPKKLATEANVHPRKSYKDTVRARHSLSISANSSLSDDPNTSIESIADIPVTLINPRYSGERKHRTVENIRESSVDRGNVENVRETSIDRLNVENVREISVEHSVVFKIQGETLSEMKDVNESGKERDGDRLEVPKTPKGRRGIRSVGESTPLINRSRSSTPERQDSPVVTPLRRRITRSRSKTPELSPRSSPLAPILEQPKQEGECEPHPEKTTLSVPLQLRSRSRTPERLDKGISESPKLEVIKESPTKSSDSSSSSPSRRSLRSRSRTPEVEIAPEPTVKASPRTLRGRSKTPEKLMSPKKEHSVRNKKSLSRIVLEANTFAKTKQTLESMESEIAENKSSESEIECTPMKAYKQVPSLMDVTLSPIVNKSVLQSSTDSALSETIRDPKSDDKNTSELGLKPLPAFTTIHETYYEKSVLRSYQSSVADSSGSIVEEKETKITEESIILKPLPAFTTINETDFNKSVLHSYESSVAESSSIAETSEKNSYNIDQNVSKPFADFAAMIENDFERSVLRSHQSSIAESDVSKEVKTDANASSLITNDSDVEMKDDTESQDTAVQKEKEKINEIEREINEIEGDMSNDSEKADSDGASTDDSDEDNDEGSEGDSDIESSESEPSTPCEEDDEDNEDANEVISIVDSDSDDSEASDESHSNQKQIQIAEIEVQNEHNNDNVEESKQHDDKVEISKQNENVSEIEVSVDPLNQAQVSLMTDDNSGVESDQSISLNYSDEKVEEAVLENKAEELKDTEKQPEIVIKVTVEEIAPIEEEKIEELAPTESVDVVDTSASEPELPIPTVPEIKVVEPMEIKETESKTSEETEVTKDTLGEKSQVEKMEIVTEKSEPEQTKLKKTEKLKEVKCIENPIPSEMEEKPQDADVTKLSEVKALEKLTQPIEEPIKPKDTVGTEEKIEIETPARRTRKRVKSTSSNKSIIDTDTDNETSKLSEISKATKDSNTHAPIATDSPKKSVEPKESEQPKTPVTRKRTQSNASKQSEEKTPEDDTPTRRRGKTPTSLEVRKIITRRVSREMAEMNESNRSLDESISLTPTRRATRRTKIDDNESVASESSVASNRSRAEDIDSKPVRKGKKSTVATKPDLSVIPEAIAEEGTKEESKLDVIDEYSGSRRLTRTQKSMVESAPSPSRGRRRASTVSRTSRSSANSERDEQPLLAFDVQPIDRISLLNKGDFEGPPDTEELQLDISPESIASDASKMRSRLARAASETKTAPRAAKINRRVASVDVAVSSDVGSPGPSGAESPARGRRASFNRAIEALHTPKGRRASTDLRRDDSLMGSPAASETDAPATPARRPRRASTHSNTSQTKSDTGKRSKKMPVLEEISESKKK